jgi:hypothetical protein
VNLVFGGEFEDGAATQKADAGDQPLQHARQVALAHPGLVGGDDNQRRSEGE